MTITRDKIGDVFYRLYDSEINFRFENMYDGGYTWALTGYQDDMDHLPRTVIDDSIQGAGNWWHAPPEIQRELDTIHFQSRDWLERGCSERIEDAIQELCEAACRIYPESEFKTWYSR